MFDRLPQPLLAALVLASVQSMFKVDELRQLLRVSKGEFLIALVTIAAVLGLGILKGVLVACVFSLAMLIRTLALPECVLLGRIPGTDHFASLVRHPDAQATPGVIVFRCQRGAALLQRRQRARAHDRPARARAAPPPRRMIIDLAFTTDLDLSTVRMLMDFARRAAEYGIAVHLADAHYRVRAPAREREVRARCSATSRGRTRSRELVDGLEFDLPAPSLSKAQAQPTAPSAS